MKRLLLLLALLPAPALAQGGMDAGAGTAVGAVTPLYQVVRGYVLAAAQQMPEADYAHRPTPEVRSFGQLIGHVANAQYMICAAALGEPNPSPQNFEQTAEKAALVQALQASSEYCDRAYAQSDEAAMQMTQLFGGERTRLSALILNAAHDFEHYGNIVTYLRLKGMVPPSSQGGG
jgi:uncharacterized damage-inducible protein DinB